jgi:ribosomal protein S18 acetylase RimI-like enzyme
MPAYRFCRPDDVPDLVEALNECAEGGEPMTVDRFRWEMRVLDVWPSSCMVAREGERPIGVLIGAKREEATLIHRLEIHPEHRRRGHASHLLTSLSQKLAVLGPPHLVAEIPGSAEGATSLFESLGYEETGPLVDWGRGPTLGSGRVPEELFVEVELADLEDLDAVDRFGSAWLRQERSLRQLGKDLHGHAIATPERVEAFALYCEGEGFADVLGIGWADGERTTALLTLLLARVEQESRRPVRLPRVQATEPEGEWLETLGFRVVGRYHRMEREAKAA